MTIYDKLQDVLNNMTSTTSQLTIAVPGIAVTIQEGNQPQRTLTSGVRNISLNLPVTKANLFEVGSTTKTYTAALILQLEEQGAFSVADTLTAVLAKCSSNPYTARLKELVQRFSFLGTITLRQFLMHTSGLKEYETTTAYKQKFIHNRYYQWSMQELISIAAAEDQGKHEFHYSDTNYVVLGLLSQAVKNQPYHLILKSQIFEKLGLTDTYYLPSDQEKVKAKLVEGYTWFDPKTNDPKQYDEAFLKQQPTCSEVKNYRNSGYDVIDVTLATNPSWGGLADGGIVATTQDVAKFARALLMGEVIDHKRLKSMLGGKDHHQLIKTNLGFNNIEVYYGLGIYYLKAPNGLEFWGMMGDEIGYQGGVFYFPKQQLLKQDIVVSYAYSLDAPGPLENLLLNLINIIELKNQAIKKQEDMLINSLNAEASEKTLLKQLIPIDNMIDKLGILDCVFQRINDVSIFSKIISYASFFCNPSYEPEAELIAKNVVLKNVFASIVCASWKKSNDGAEKEDLMKMVRGSHMYRSNSNLSDYIDRIFAPVLSENSITCARL